MLKTKKIKMSKPNKMPIKVLIKKADKLMQQVGMKENGFCMVCNKPQSCMHHYIPKSICASLRYDHDNLIPICVSCHFRHHSASEPMIHEVINRKKGQEWQDRLNGKRTVGFVWKREMLEKIINDYNDRLK